MTNMERAILEGKFSDIQREDLMEYVMSRAHEYHCGSYLHHLSGVERVQLYQELETERIRDKYHKIATAYGCRGNDWNQIMFLLLMRALADKYHKEQFMELAHRVGYANLLRERDSVENIEAMLIVASGLSGLLPIDEFTDSICRRGMHLLHKYEIEKMRIEQWKRPKLPASISVLARLLQVATLIFDNDLLFNKILACRKRDDLLVLFNAKLRKEWLTYFRALKGLAIGVSKRDVIGINVVVPLLYVYGRYSQNETYTDAASDLNESIPAESNYYITAWRESGLNPTIAYETQALIQLASVYCRQSREDRKARATGEEIAVNCAICPLFKHMTSRASGLYRVPAFFDY